MKAFLSKDMEPGLQYIGDISAVPHKGSIVLVNKIHYLVHKVRWNLGEDNYVIITLVKID